MAKKTFRGGVHPLYFKELSRKAPIRGLKPPLQVIIPLIQHTGAACLPIVKVGDGVKIGTLIGNSEKFISAPIHSSVSGKVKAIKKLPHPVLGRSDSVLIESDGKDEVEDSLKASGEDVKSLGPDEIRNIIKEAGIVGLGGAAFPTHVKLTPPKEKPIDTFILNGAECEPYLTCDERVIIERPKEVLEGAALIMKTLGLKRGFVAIEDNKPEAIEAIRTTLKNLQLIPRQARDPSPRDPERIRGAAYPSASSGPLAERPRANARGSLQLAILHTKYPQGGEKQLIKAILKREVPAGGMPFDVGCIVGNIQTALAVYEAVYKRKPLYERVITVTGDAVKEPSNLLVRIGTPISYVIENCGGLKERPSKIIIGGPMMGIAQYTSDVPVIKGTSGVLILSAKYAQVRPSEHCIRCGKCIEACPVNLIPTEIARAAEYGRFDIAGELHAPDCIECGVCAYICPSNIPLVQLIKHAKRSLLCQI